MACVVELLEKNGQKYGQIADISHTAENPPNLWSGFEPEIELGPCLGICSRELAKSSPKCGPVAKVSCPIGSAFPDVSG